LNLNRISLEAGGASNVSIRKPVFRFGQADEGLIAAASGSRLPDALLQLPKGGRLSPERSGRT
jgi:hypothetical protein